MATVAGSKRLLDISGNNVSTAVSLTASGTLLDTNGAAGASNQVLSSTGSGVDWVDASSVIGGPYLPLTGGTIAGGLTVEGTTILDSLQLETSSDYITFYGGNSTQHSISSRQLNGSPGDDLRFNTYGSFIINLDSNNNQSSATNSSFYIARHGGDSGDLSSNILFDINGENGDVTTTGTLTAPNLTIGSGNKIQFANNDYIRYDDTGNRFHFDADGGASNASVQASTFVGNLITGNIGGNNYNITGVNQLEINDPGEGIVWKAGSSGDITLAVVDDSSDNILRLSGTGATLQVGSNNVFHDGYHPNADKWTTARTITLSGDLNGSASIDGSSNVTLSAQVVNNSHTHDDRYVELTGDTMTGPLTISNSSPVLRLNDNDSTNTTNQLAFISLQSQSSETGWIGFGSSGNDNLTVKNTSGKVVLDGSTGVNIPNGNVGIGTTSPSQKLEVSGNIAVSGTVDGVDISAFKSSYDDHNHDDRYYTETESEGRYVKEGGTSFSGVYPMVVRVGARNIYSHPNITYTGSNSSLFVGGDVRAPIFYDTNNTTYYVNPASTSNLNSVTLSGRLNLDLATDYDSTVVTSLTTAPLQVADVNVGTTDTYLPLAHMSARYTSGYRTHMNIGLKKAPSAWGDTQTGMYVALGGNDSYPTRNWLFSYGGYIKSGVDGVHATDSFRAPVFYDSDNTSRFINPAGDSTINGLIVQGLSEFYSNSHFEYNVNVAGTLDGYLANIDYLGLGAAPNTSGTYRINMGGNIDMNANSIDYISQLHFNDNVRFYDDGNDSYLNFKYGDGGAGGIRIRDNGSAVKGTIYADTGSFGLLDRDGSWAVRTQTGTNPLELRCDNNTEFQVYNSYTLSPGSSRAPIFYDSNNTGYYLNPASTSVLNQGKFTSTLSFGLFTPGSQGVQFEGYSTHAVIRNDADRLDFYMGNSSGGVGTMMTLTKDGNVGIGTTSPAAKLHVNGEARVYGSGSAYYVNMNANSSWGYFNTNAARIYLNKELQVDTGLIGSYNEDLQLRTQGSTKMYISNSSGNVGIGTTTPSYKLHVNGTTYANGSIIGSSDLWLKDQSSVYSAELKMQNNTHTIGIDYQNNETLRFITRSGTTTVPITFQMRAGTITAANFILSSDERKKTKIADLSCDSIDVSWKSFEMKDNEGEYRTGVIAQELEQKHPEFVNTNDEGFKSVKYIDLLIAKIAELEARLEKAGL